MMKFSGPKRTDQANSDFDVEANDGQIVVSTGTPSPSSTVTTLTASTSTLTIAASSTPAENAMQMLKSVLASTKRIITLPTLNTENSVLGLTMLTSATAKVANLLLDQEVVEKMAPVAAAQAVTALAGAGIAQAGAYRGRLLALQTAQKEIIKAVEPNIMDCFYIQDGKEIRLANLSADSVIAAMEKYGHISVQLNKDDLKFNFVYNSFCSWRTARTFGFAALPTFIFAISQLAEYHGYEIDDRGIVQAGLGIAQNVPWAKGYDRLHEIFTAHRQNALEVYCLVLGELYLKPGRAKDVPEALVTAFETLFGKEKTDELRLLLEAARKEEKQPKTLNTGTDTTGQSTLGTATTRPLLG
ncbi:MAG TPA: hypothetical protein VLG38_00755 [Gammaproteobacteria bacterium]|nr:hypothetical protein [Gammaproteobacteria bacterium]